MTRVIHVNSHPSVASDDHDGTSERPVLTFGRALELSRYGDVIAYDGMLGTMVPVPQTRQPCQHRWDDLTLRLFWAAVVLGALIALTVVAFVLTQAFALWWHHPIGGALVCGVLAIAGYIWHCKRHGIPL